ncbi:hypothetical protein Ciccas_006296 [Cichlidogyrus casuarinus]|uniref:Uncharacterized protein n=1 Tax=Cichlidogyrus casuarinus TaxID=1844966 RepID=A0ABD2Q6A5_9PLAT
MNQNTPLSDDLFKLVTDEVLNALVKIKNKFDVDIEYTRFMQKELNMILENLDHRESGDSLRFVFFDVINILNSNNYPEISVDSITNHQAILKERIQWILPTKLIVIYYSTNNCITSALHNDI